MKEQFRAPHLPQQILQDLLQNTYKQRLQTALSDIKPQIVTQTIPQRVRCIDEPYQKKQTLSDTGVVFPPFEERALEGDPYKLTKRALPPKQPVWKTIQKEVEIERATADDIQISLELPKYGYELINNYEQSYEILKFYFFLLESCGEILNRNIVLTVHLPFPERLLDNNDILATHFQKHIKNDSVTIKSASPDKNKESDFAFQWYAMQNKQKNVRNSADPVLLDLIHIKGIQDLQGVRSDGTGKHLFHLGKHSNFIGLIESLYRSFLDFLNNYYRNINHQ